MQALPFFLAAAVQKASIGQTFLSAFPHLLGMLVVMITLTVLWGLCELTAHLIKTFAPPPAVVAVPAAAQVARDVPAVQVTTGATAMSPETVVVIAAAVNTVLGTDYKVVAIKPHDSSWEKAGRQAVLSSHRLR